MKVKELIKQLEKINEELDVWISSDGISFEIADYVEVDDENDVLISAEIERNY